MFKWKTMYKIAIIETAYPTANPNVFRNEKNGFLLKFRKKTIKKFLSMVLRFFCSTFHKKCHFE